MHGRKSLDIFSLFLYAPVWLIFLCLSALGNNAEPFGLALLFALSNAGLNPFLCGAGYLLSSLPFLSLSVSGVYLCEAILLCPVFFFMQKRKTATRGNCRELFLPFFAFAVGLLLYFFIPPYIPYAFPLSFLEDARTQKCLLFFLLFLLAAVFSIAARAIFNKFLKCRLRTEELLCAALLYLATGLGFCRFFGFNAYLGVAFFFLLLFCHITKDGTGVLFSFLLALPCAMLGGVPIERFFILSVLLSLFCHTGKIGLAFVLLSCNFFFFYQDGLLVPFTTSALPSILSVALPTLLFLLLPKPLYQKLEKELIFYREKHLSRIAVNLGRAAVGSQLYELSTLFREIQTTFLSLSDDSAEKNACVFIVNTVWQDCCRACASFNRCRARGMKEDLSKLVEIGCMKGRTSLIDMTENMAKTCDRQSDLLYHVNVQLTDFRRFMTEAENVKSGRALLAAQAQGVSEILKNVALEQSQPLQMQAQAEKALYVAFLKAGIVCSEIMLCGEEEDFTLSLITFGKVSVPKITEVATYVLDKPLLISKKLPLNRDKCCFILRRRPYYDAAFGIASKTKEGEKVCGDGYSVVKIDERRFMVALADGWAAANTHKKSPPAPSPSWKVFIGQKCPLPSSFPPSTNY